VKIITRYGRLEVYHCHVTDLQFQVKVHRWYRLQLPDAIPDPTDPTLWEHVEYVPITLSTRLDGPGFATKSVSILENDRDTARPIPLINRGRTFIGLALVSMLLVLTDLPAPTIFHLPSFIDSAVAPPAPWWQLWRFLPKGKEL
jgi:hypothetical protein